MITTLYERGEKEMALITCPECGKQISDLAQSCPNCGFPIGFMSSKNEEKNEKH